MDNMYNNFGEVTETKVAFGALLRKVYLWMTLALAITGLTAAWVAQSGAIYQISQGWFFGTIGLELLLVIFLSTRIWKMSFATAGVTFALYSILNGVTMSFIFLAYEFNTIATTFFITAGTFGGMALLGYITKKDLSVMGRLFYMALIGLIIAGIVNLFVANNTFDWVVSIAGVLIFCGITAWDSQRIKIMLQEMGDEENENTMKLALIGSLELYLDFINIFLYLLRLFKDN